MADLPAKQAQYVAYAEKDSKARNIATTIDTMTTSIENISDDVSLASPYEYNLTVAETTSLVHYLTGNSDWSFYIGLNTEEAFKHSLIKLSASFTIPDPDTGIDVQYYMDCILTKVATLDVDSALSRCAYRSDEVQLTSSKFILNIAYVPSPVSVELSGKINVITSADIDSETATVGQVLTADGTGGCSWQSAGGSASEPNIIVNLNCALSAFATENGAWRNDFITQQQEMPTWLAGIDEATLSSGASDPLDTVIYAKTTDDVLIPIHVALNTEMGTMLSLCLKISSYYYVIQMWYEANSETGYNLIVLWGTNDPSASNN